MVGAFIFDHPDQRCVTVAVDLARFAQLRPYLYHLTAAHNIPRIRRLRALASAQALLRAAGRDDLIRVRRRVAEVITVGEDTVHVRDQAPLHAGNMGLSPGWTFDDVVLALNARVFFWPGTQAGPIAYGLRHYQRYSSEGPRVIRVETAALIDCNAGAVLEVCRFNSGSPRWNSGRPSPRGSATFVRPEVAGFLPRDVVEVTLLDQALLPAGAVLSASPGGPWEPLF